MARTARLPILLAAVALVVVTAVAVGLFLRLEARHAGGAGLPLDDSWIHLQFARSLASGEGMAYRHSELVSGSTAPLWTALVSVLLGLSLPPVPAVKALGLLLHLALGWATWHLGRELGVAATLALLGAGLVLLCDVLIWSALSGMEIPLFALLTTWGLAEHLREGRQGGAPRSLYLLGLACLARPEGALLLGLAVLDRLWPRPARRRFGFEPTVVGVVAALLVTVPAVLLSVRAGGSALPTTAAVKTDGPQALLPSLRHLWLMAEVLFRSQPWMLALAPAGVLRLTRDWGSERSRGLALPLWVLGLPLAYALLSPAAGPPVIGNFGRYLYPLLPLVIVLGLLALDEPLGAWLGRLHRPGRALVSAVLVLLILVPVPRSLRLGAERYALNVRNVNDSDVAAARWLRERVSPEALLAVQDIGALGYLTPNPILDLAGIATPEILPYLEGPLRGDHPSGLEGLFDFLRSRRPALLVLFPESYGGLEALRSVEPRLEVWHRFEVPTNITMAGSELVVLRTPWWQDRFSRPSPPGV